MKGNIMMTKKSEMAEWILDFFRRAKVTTGQIVMFRNLQFAQQQLNPKERLLFLSVMNELLEHGYFTFEQEPIQCLRLAEKGNNYIYGLTKTLDCCIDKRITTENDLRTLIELGFTVTLLQRYSELLQYGTAIEQTNLLYNQLMKFDYTSTSNYSNIKIDTILEYYVVIFRNIHLTCKVILDIDDEQLLPIIKEYVEMAINSLSQYMLIKVPINQDFVSLISQAKAKLSETNQQSLLTSLNRYLSMVLLQN